MKNAIDPEASWYLIGSYILEMLDKDVEVFTTEELKEIGRLSDGSDLCSRMNEKFRDIFQVENRRSKSEYRFKNQECRDAFVQDMERWRGMVARRSIR